MKFSKYILVIGMISLLASISFASSTTKQNCPILGAYYYDRFGYYYECIDSSKPDGKKFYGNYGIGWYTPNDKEYFEWVGSKNIQDLTTDKWVENRLRVEPKKERGWIESDGLMLEEISNETMKLNFVEEGCFFRLYEDIFTNIVPISTSFVEFDYINKEVISANFVVEKDGGSYTFGDNSFYAPPNSRIIFDKETGIEINIKDGTDLTDMSDLFKFNTGYPIKIKGKNIPLPNGINLVNGKVIIDNRGYVFGSGKALYWQNFFIVDEDTNEILFANKDADLFNYKGNYVEQTNNILRLQSFKDRSIYMKFLGEIPIQIENSDGLEITDNPGSPSTISHFGSDKGKTTIDNRFTFYEDRLSMNPDFLGNKDYIPFKLKSDFLDTELQFNSDGQFEILSKDGEKIVSYNKYQLA